LKTSGEHRTHLNDVSLLQWWHMQ